MPGLGSCVLAIADLLLFGEDRGRFSNDRSSNEQRSWPLETIVLAWSYGSESGLPSFALACARSGPHLVRSAS